MTLTWREELTLRIECLQGVIKRDLEEFDQVLDLVQEKVLEEDRALRQLRAAKRKGTRVEDPRLVPDQVPSEEPLDVPTDPDLHENTGPIQQGNSFPSYEAHNPDQEEERRIITKTDWLALGLPFEVFNGLELALQKAKCGWCGKESGTMNTICLQCQVDLRVAKGGEKR